MSFGQAGGYGRQFTGYGELWEEPTPPVYPWYQRLFFTIFWFLQ